MTPVEVLEAAIDKLQREVALYEARGWRTDVLGAELAILDRALVLAKRGHKDTLKLELALAEAWL